MMGDDTYEQISLRNVAPVVQVGIEDGNMVQWRRSENKRTI
jgi:hypothetical protein